MIGKCLGVGATRSDGIGLGARLEISVSMDISLLYRIYRRYIDGYFFMNIDISKINKNTLKVINILSKSVKMTLIIKYIHCNEFLKSK